MVPQATSLPLTEKSVKSFRPLLFLNSLEAKAKPNSLGICAAVGEMSAEALY